MISIILGGGAVDGISTALQVRVDSTAGTRDRAGNITAARESRAR
jgi:hypothetical protein